MDNSIDSSVQFLKGYIRPQDIGVILGSGLGDFVNELDDVIFIDYEDIPNFPISTVQGHKGRFAIGKYHEKKIIAMQGRFHYYEGYSMKEVVFPIRVMSKLGIKHLIVTNAAGAVSSTFEPGQLMLIKDHINLLGDNPLIGQNDKTFGTRFPDMTDAYSKSIRQKIINKAKEMAIDLKEGIYAAMTGPSYETPAEIKMLQLLGVDAVGMSTVPEVITAVHSGIKVVGISCLTNMAAGILKKKLNHEEVIKTSKLVKDKFIKIVEQIIDILD